MPTDAYGNEIEDPFDLAIARGVMRSTWSSAAFAVFFAMSPVCCVPVGQWVSGGLFQFYMFVAGLIALAAGINVAVRVFSMQPEHKRLVPSWHPWGALGLAVAAAILGALQLAGLVGSFALVALTK